MIKDSKVGDFFAEFDRRFRNGEKKPLTASVFGAKSGMTVSEYIDSAKERAEAWNYADALQMYVWSHYNCLDFEPSRYGVRLSYDLSDWKKLGEKYPPAFEALINIREEKTSLLLRGKGDKYLFHDVFAINRTFDEHSLSIELYEKLEVIDPALADSCWWIIEATLFHARNLKAILKRSPELLTKPVETMNSFVESLRNFQEAFKLNDKEEITD